MGFWITLLITSVLFVLSELLRPKPDIEDAKAAGLGDFQFPTAQEDRPVPVIWGTVRQKGPNVIWYGDLIQAPISVKIKTGLFSSEDQITGYRYSLGVQFALCRGPIDSLLRIWVGDVEIPGFTTVLPDGTFTLDCPELFGGAELGSGGLLATGVLHGGSDTQASSSYLGGFQSVSGQTCAYRGTCYVAPLDTPFYLGNSTSIKAWAFEIQRIPSQLTLGAADTVNSFDANPAEVIYEILTDTEWGLGISPSKIDTTSFQNAGATLASEGNGFSYLWDRIQDVNELLRLVEEQIDGLVFQDLDGLFKINLARADYDIDDVPEITLSNRIEMADFTRGSWSDTTNVVLVKYNDRLDDYKSTYAPAQDSSNIRIQQGLPVTATKNFPGVKDSTLADTLAWRELRTLSYPLAKAEVIVDRTFWDVQPGSVVSFTDNFLGLSKLPMRVQAVDLGDLEDGRIKLNLVQDIFATITGSFGAPPTTGWEEPVDNLVAYPTDQQLVFEAPKAFIDRDPNSTTPDRVWAGARRQGNEVGFQMVQRNAASNPSGAFTLFGESYLLLHIGQLLNDLAQGTNFPLTSVPLTAAPSTQNQIETAFTDTTDPSDLGENLVNLVYVGGEFMLVGSAQVFSTFVQMNNVYRGALDSVQQAHSSGDDVYLLFVGGNLSDDPIPIGNEVDVKLLPFSATDVLGDSGATEVTFNMEDRYRKPIAPSVIYIEGSDWPSTVSLEATGADDDNYRMELEIQRRDWRTFNQIDALNDDAETLDSTYPAENSTTHTVEVINDPDGVATSLFSLVISSTTVDVDRNQILKELDGVLPTELQFSIKSTHTVGGVSYDSFYNTEHQFDVTSGLTGDFNFGALNSSDTSNLYTATVAGTYQFDLVNSLSGNVEYRINAGSWTTLISSGATTGSIAGVLVSDTIEVRHLDSGLSGSVFHFLGMSAAGAGQDGYAIIF